MDTEQQNVNLTDYSGAPFIFYLKDGTELGLDDWTVYSEKWAKKAFGSMAEFNKVIFQALMDPKATEADMDRAIDASFMVAAHQLDENSRRIVNEMNAGTGWSTEEFLARNMGTKILNRMCEAIVEMFKDSLPVGWEEQVKKKLGPTPRRPTPPTKRR